jgi:hypothetical protein
MKVVVLCQELLSGGTVDLTLSISDCASFAPILVLCESGDVRGLWDRLLEVMYDGYMRNHTWLIPVEQRRS